jgi:hypothetical protein
MRLIPARAEAGLDAVVGLVSGVVAALIASGKEVADPILLAVVCGALFGGLALWQLQWMRKAAVGGGSSGEVMKPVRSLLVSAPIGALVVAAAFTGNSPSFGVFIATAGGARLVTVVGLWRFENRSGYQVLRITGAFRNRGYVLWQDPAPAHRNHAHAQSEAP